jgi:hypothetical protein
VTVRFLSAPLLIVTALSVLLAPHPAGAYNDQQHQGMTAIAYKAMVAAALEGGCSPSIDFKGAPITEHVGDFPGAFLCGTTEEACRAEWDDFLRQTERAIRFLRGIDSSLPRDDDCPVELANTGPLGAISFSVDANYGRDSSCAVSFALIQPAGEKQRRCSAPSLLCDEKSIYQFLAPEDHTGDILGYWATEPDHDLSTVKMGFKPVFPGVGKTLQTMDEIAQDTLGALFMPAVCAFEFLFGGSDCVNTAKSLADDAVPVDEIAGVIPVLFPREDPDFLGLFHYVDIPDDNSPCDDLRGMLYERAGPKKIPDALDLVLIAASELGQQYIDFSESTGPARFNITDPGDGDQPSCERDRGDWEIAPFGHIVFSPVDNLGLFGWKEFTTPGNLRQARSLGWPLHAIGDAVAPHHVVGTTGWGHRPFEESAQQNWNRILFQDLTSVADVRERQYLQLRRILVQGFTYWRLINILRAQHPTGNDQLTIPIRAFVTQVARDVFAEVTGFEGQPRWPLDPTLSLPYFVDVGLRQSTIDRYKDDESVDGERLLLERGAGATLAFLTATGQLSAPFSVAPRCGSPDALFPECGASSACSDECCIPAVSNCPEICSRDDCQPGSIFCRSTCPTGKACDPNGCCIVTACDAPCRTFSDCPPGGGCESGCCGVVVR